MLLLDEAAAQLKEIHRAKHYGLWRSEADERLNRELKEVQPFRDYRDIRIHMGDGSHLATSPKFGSWAINRLVEGMNPKEILTQFQSEIERNISVYTEASPVWGGQIDEQCVINNEVNIVPEPEDSLVALLQKSSFERDKLPSHTAILHQTYTVTPAFEHCVAKNRTCSGTSTTLPPRKERDAVRVRVRLACALASGGPVELPLTALQPDRGALFVTGEGNQWGRAFGPRPLSSFPVKAKAVKRNYEALAAFDEFDSLERSIDRLARSRLASSPADRALDLGIATEIALMHGQGENNAEITHKIGIRAAWLLGQDIEERQTIFNEIKKLYSARSQAVHSGTLTKKSRVDLNAADHLVTRLLKTILDLGYFPNWNRLAMGAGGQD